MSEQVKSPDERLLELFKKYDNIFPLANNLFRVESRRKFGVYSKEVDDFIAQIEFHFIDRLTDTLLKVEKDGNRGLLNTETREVIWKEE